MSTIIGIKISNRIEEATKLQEILTNYGCVIKTRIGLHYMVEYKCLNYGIVLMLSKLNRHVEHCYEYS